MRLKPDEIKKLTNYSGNLLLKQPTVTLKGNRVQILETIERALTHHFQVEWQVEKESEQLYSEHVKTIGVHERGKALHMIRKQLADKKGLVLSGGPTGRFSQDKMIQMAHEVADRLWDDDLLDFPHEDDGRRFFKKIFEEYFVKQEQVYAKARKKILSLASPPFEGSREWEVLFKKYVEEEINRMK